jgi:hypothetical protein
MRQKTFLIALLATANCALAQENCGFPVSLARSGFESGEQPSIALLPAENTPISVTLAGPTAGATLGVSSVQLYGTYTGPANTGIAVNGVAAIVNGNSFVTPRIPLTAGNNTLTLSYAGLDQAPQTLTRSVTYDAGVNQAVLLTAAGPGDFAPVRVRYGLSTKLPPAQTAITRVQVDYNDDGVFEFDGTQPQNLEYAFETSGLFASKARVTFDDGDSMTAPVVIEDRTRVLIQDMAFTRQTLCGVYYAMKSRLAAGNITSALNTLTPTIRGRFQPLWTTLASNNMLTQTANRLGQVVNGQIARSNAEFQIAIPTMVTGSLKAYQVRFRKDANGVWRIASM